MEYRPDEPNPHHEQTFTENEILELFYAHWVELMRNVPSDQGAITPLACLQDWVIVNWADRI